MDLHLIPNAIPTQAERSAIDNLLGQQIPRERSAQAIPNQRHLLLPALLTVQSTSGHITPGTLNHLCQRLDIAPAEAYGVATFYHLLTTEPGPVLHLCDDIVCRASGALDLAQQLTIPYRLTPCLGQCERAPAALLHANGQEQTIAPASLPALMAALKQSTDGAAFLPGAPQSAGVSDLAGRGLVPRLTHPMAPTEGTHGRPPGSLSAPQTQDPTQQTTLRLLKRAGRTDPESLEHYRASGGYQALTKALKTTPEAIIEDLLTSRLVGRGGAAFPAGRKWEAIAQAPEHPHYLVCNADESEPGTFKDRVLMEEDPFALVEAMTIAARATGCETGYIYVRGEYPTAHQRLLNAVGQARQQGLLGQGILNSGLTFDIELRRGAGAYICGEETALFNSLEGRRGEPRNKPPFPTEAGLFGKPTLVNNVETLLNVLEIVERGGEAFAETGTESSTGTKLFCVSGSVARPGVYEVPFGATLHQLLNLAEHPGNMQAILLGGAAGTFLTEEDLDVPLTFEATRAIGATLGSGAVIVFDETVDLRDTLKRITRFFREESCGQCVPCRIGTQRLEESVHRLANGTSLPHELPLIEDISQAMRDASICGLGQTAPSALQSAIAKGLIGGAVGLLSPLAGES